MRGFGLEAESAECVEKAVWILQMHVVPSCAGLAVAALEEEDFLSLAATPAGMTVVRSPLWVEMQEER